MQLLSMFAKAFTVPTFANAMVLPYGTILAPGRRTVAAALRHGAGRQPALHQLPSRPQSSQLIAVDFEQTAVESDPSPPAAAWTACTPGHR
jgi:hypothetical protein